MADPLHNLRTITARHIRHLPVRVDLLKSANRALNLYQAFGIKFNIDFSSLTPAMKRRVLLPFRPAVGQVHGDIDLNDDEEEEAGEAAAAAGLNHDADAVANHRLDFVARIRLAADIWRGYTQPVREAWKAYALKLNRLRVPGLVTVLPPHFYSFTVRGTTAPACSLSLLCMHSMFEEWTAIVSFIRNSILMGYRNGEPQNAEYYFGRERITIGMQIFRRYIKISKLLKTLLFGNNFEKVSDFVVYRSNAKLVLHIHSNQDLNRLFTVAGLSAFSFWNNQRAYHGAAKIHLRYGRRNYRGYVMNKTSSSPSQLSIRLNNNDVVKMPAPTEFHETDLEWNFRDGPYTYQQREFTQTEYHPIRIVLSRTKHKICRMSYLCHRCVLERNGTRRQINEVRST